MMLSHGGNKTRVLHILRAFFENRPGRNVHSNSRQNKLNFKTQEGKKMSLVLLDFVAKKIIIKIVFLEIIET